MAQHEQVEERSGLVKVITASSVGTMIEWYDFYIFGSLATIISTKFFPSDNPTAALLSTLATFAAGFVVRPFGAIFFGRLGDLIGRKYTFMLTLLIMGVSTTIIGLIPGYETIGFFAPLIVLLLRLLQGLALGGEYGGAATYVAEHCEPHNKGFWTSWIQTTATVGLMVSLMVILATREILGPEVFGDWGWRIPFILSFGMVVVSYYIRRGMSESPIFKKAKAEGKTSVNPLKESFGHVLNMKYVLLALLGAVMGQGVVWYTGQFYAMFFMKANMNLDGAQVDILMTYALLLGTPLFVLFGWMSDKIGRKWLMVVGMVIAVASYQPIYKAMYNTTDVNKKQEVVAKTTSVVTKVADAKNNKDTLTTTKIAKEYTDGTTYSEVKKETKYADAAKKPLVITTKNIKINDSDRWTLIFWVFIQLVFVTMTYGPIAAFLVELFPTKVRYTSMSLPYHIGNGVFGGLMPTIATYLTSVAKTDGNPEWYLQGLLYPMIIAGVCAVIGAIYIDKKSLIHHH